VSAADEREEAEALLWRYGLTAPQVDAILARVDACAEARVEAEVRARLDAERERIRLVRREARAAVQRRDVQACGTVAAARRHRLHGDIPDGLRLRDVCEPCADAEGAAWQARRAS
jgi:hypothetical protein